MLRTATTCWMFRPPKRHEWQIPREDLPQVQGVDTWAQLSTNDYVRVPDSKREDAVALLQDRSFLQLEASLLSVFAPSLQARSELQPYLVRGVSYSTHPAYTVVRFDTPTGRLFVEQATYDGEMFMPFRWVVEPNALVVCLPQAPQHIYPYPRLGGDGIFRGRGRKDTR